ncbi:carboxypeptidase D [Raphidocelis subcapitata]|uniref:Carboxypeptidase D n=1 Tax=Raphidocelis subcapitata TaxID=307507 RepID=A0A2V0PAM6_9CHLO|nr:carboxypeptidase D [Raphidocelis subcapitata]|eukprot:GBF96908.1 carboxypeptidase D [Raphidocelis subcapitata]
MAGARTRTARLALVALICAGSAALSAAQEVGSQQAPTGRRLSDQLLKTYLSNPQLSAWADEYVARCGAIARKFVVGRAGSGAEIVGVEISDRPGAAEPEPSFKYVANMHGDETSGRMLLPMLAEWLCANNGKDPRATRLVRDAHLFLVPTMNPDGFAARWRGNKNGVDLNRNFPDAFVNRNWDLRQPLPNSQPETAAVMAWSLAHNFAASANMHEGAVVTNYPFDSYSDPRQRSGPNAAPEDATFRFLSHTYANKHAFMARSQEFPGGITNGADWYEIHGGMQDWNYLAAGTMELTLELSQDKYPAASRLPALWEENRDALLALAATAALGGVRGNVTAGGAPVAATLYVKPPSGYPGKPVPFYADKDFGFYARPLPPGRHTIVASAPGFEPAEAELSVPSDGSGAVANIALKRARAAKRGGERPAAAAAAVAAATPLAVLAAVPARAVAVSAGA